MLKNIKVYVDKLKGFQKFLFRLSYPILLFLLMYFILVKGLQLKLSTIQLFFIIIWAYLEWTLFFRKR